ncbi:MAG: SRPBCC family protein, partial [Planctomycetales bacterium]
MPLFESTTHVAAPPDELFAFFLDPANRPYMSPPELGMIILTGPNPLTVGSRLEFKVMGMGLVQQMLHEITDLEPNVLMAEKQIKGPLTSFLHRHHFKVLPNGGTELRDEIEFAPPGGILGLLATEDKILDSFEDGFY